MKLLTILVLSLLFAAPAYARGFSSGSHSSFSSGHTSTSHTTTSGGSHPTYRSSAPKVNSSKPIIGGYSTSGSKVTSSSRPTYSGGYSPPVGSVVFNRGFSLTDLFFWSYIFSHNGQQQVAVQQPDGKKVQTTDPSQVDWMYYIDWAIMIILAIGVIIFIVWIVNKYTSPKGGPLHASI